MITALLKIDMYTLAKSDLVPVEPACQRINGVYGEVRCQLSGDPTPPDLSWWEPDIKDSQSTGSNHNKIQ